MFGIDAETAIKVIGGIIGAGILTIVGKLGVNNRRTDAGNSPPTASGFVLDGDMALAIRDTLRTILANQERFHAEEDRRREIEERRDLQDEKQDAKAELDALRAGQQKTHGNQAGIFERVDATDRKIDDLMKALSNPKLAEALKGLDLH